MLSGLPTSIIVLILVFFIKKLYLNPLEAVLAERYRRTEGARLAAEASLQSADSKVAEYEAALDNARRGIYAEQAEFLRNLHAEHAARAVTAKAAADSTLAAARASLAAEVEEARAGLAAQSEQLAASLADTVLSRRVA